MARRLVLGGAAVAAVAAALGALAVRGGAAPVPAPTAAAPLPADVPSQPIDAGRIQTGRLALERMPPEVAGALEAHSVEIVRTAEVLASKQARVSGTCAPGSAIRVVGEDGSVVCQKLGRGVVSVTSLAGVPRVSSTGTTQASVPGGVGRYQTSGDDDFLVVPIVLPDGAIVTGFTYVYWDADPKVDGGAFLYRSDDVVMAGLASEDAREEVRSVTTADVKERRVDAAYAYFVYMQISAQAGPNLVPIAASVSYRLP